MSRRDMPPTLLIPLPLCDVCGLPVEVRPHAYRCVSCGITWDETGRSFWDEPEAEQCDCVQYRSSEFREKRCILTKGHSHLSMHSDGTGFLWD